MQIHQNPSNAPKIKQNHIKINPNQRKSIKINPNLTYMHHNLQRKRKSKSHSLLHILGLLVSHV